jgi:outer membrane protein TolC
LQDARFLELVAAYKQSVLTANQEAENGLVTFLNARERFEWQKKSADAGKSALETVQKMYPDKENFTRVAQLLQTQVVLEDTLAQVQGEILLGLISVYKGLGGGWEIRCTGCPAPAGEMLLPVPKQLDIGNADRPPIRALLGTPVAR